MDNDWARTYAELGYTYCRVCEDWHRAQECFLEGEVANVTTYRKSSEVLANEVTKLTDDLTTLMGEQPAGTFTMDTVFILTAMATQTKAILALVEATRELSQTIRGKQF